MAYLCWDALRQTRDDHQVFGADSPEYAAELFAQMLFDIGQVNDVYLVAVTDEDSPPVTLTVRRTTEFNVDRTTTVKRGLR